MSKPTHLIRLNKSDPHVSLDWSIGYEGLKFNCYRPKGGTDWIYTSNYLCFIAEEQVTECGPAHDAVFNEGDGTHPSLYCATCNERFFLNSYAPRPLQEYIRRFILQHGAPANWDFERWVLRAERRYHYSDYRNAPDATDVGLKILATKLTDGKIVVTDDEGNLYVKQ